MLVALIKIDLEDILYYLNIVILRAKQAHFLH